LRVLASILHLADALAKKGDKAGAAQACCHGGDLLFDQGDWADDAKAYRDAIANQPDLAVAHCKLGLSLQQSGLYAEAVDELKTGHELGSKAATWTFPSQTRIRECERLIGRSGVVLGDELALINPGKLADRTMVNVDPTARISEIHRESWWSKTPPRSRPTNCARHSARLLPAEFATFDIVSSIRLLARPEIHCYSISDE
jgi:tetratricopeptide (TPR) repeat protein